VNPQDGGDDVAKSKDVRVVQAKTVILPVELTEKETRDFGKRLAALEGELSAHTNKEKEVKDNLKGERSSLEGKIKSLAVTLNQGHEYRPVSVRVEVDYRTNTVREIREDTEEIVSERAPTEEERQASLDLGGLPSFA
jgi:hypothetical protein